MMQIFDWSKFTLKIYIKAPLYTVYNAWTTRQNLENWFLRKAEFRSNGIVVDNNKSVTAGDTFQWMWHGYPDENFVNGFIIEVNNSDYIKFNFGTAGNVTVKLKEVGELTEMILIQDSIPTDDKSKAEYHVGCSTGWTFYFANLKSILEGGLDLRNKNPQLTNVINS